MGLFAMLEDDAPGTAIPVPKKPEFSRAELMSMEKETTGLYLSGHPMDDYRKFLKNTHVISIGSMMDEESKLTDDQIVSVAGIVQSVKMKSTRNNSIMAYVTLEDDTAAVEMLAFSNVLNQFGGYLKENSAIVVTGRLSLRDDKEPQIVVNRARPISDFAAEPQHQQPAPVKQNLTGKLYLKLATEEGKQFQKVRAILNMFPGESQAVVYFADSKVRRGTRCALAEAMLNELKNVLGAENVVVK